MPRAATAHRSVALALIVHFAVPILPGAARAAAQDAADPIGIVDRVSGPWLRVQDRQPLARGDLMYAGQTVMAGGATSGSIVILLFSGGRWQRACTTERPCAGSYRPGGTGDSDRGFWAFLSSFWKSGRQLPPVLAGSRGVLARGPVHALVRIEDGAADLAPALANLDPGRRVLRLVPAPGAALEGSGGIHEWTADIDDGPAHVEGISPGLYVLSVTDAEGQSLGSTALVLLRPASDARAHATWAEARSHVDAWPDIEPGTRAALLAQTLYALDAYRD